MSDDGEYEISTEFFLELYGRMRWLYVDGKRIDDDELEELCNTCVCKCGDETHNKLVRVTIRFCRGILESCDGKYPTVASMKKSVEHGGGRYNVQEKIVQMYHKEK